MSATSVVPIRSLRSRVDAYIINVSQRYAPVKLSFEICIAINRFVASPSAPQMLHRVIGGAPVTYVFLSRVHARSFLSRYSPAAAVSVDVSLSASIAYGLLSNEQQCLVEEKRAPLNDAIVQRLAVAPDSAILLKEEWLEHVLCGRKSWEIRTACSSCTVRHIITYRRCRD